MRMHRIILSSLTCLIPPYFPTLSHKIIDSRTDDSEHKICVLIFYKTFSEKFLIPRRIRKDTVVSVQGVHVKCTGCSCKVSVILVRI
jgi:hypothetical protein